MDFLSLLKSQTGCTTFVAPNDEGLRYNDNEWHNMRVIRIGNRGYIYVDFHYKGDISVFKSVMYTHARMCMHKDSSTVSDSQN